MCVLFLWLGYGELARVQLLLHHANVIYMAIILTKLRLTLNHAGDSLGRKKEFQQSVKLKTLRSIDLREIGFTS